MNFDEYEQVYFDVYEEFAATVRFILKKAIESSPQVPKPQATQSRAKHPLRLKARLEEAKKLDTQTLEKDRRDLAGVRLIFYTNTDVEKLLNSRIVFDNFAIETDAVRVHTPTHENDQSRYQAIHYVVRLSDERVRLPEYARFAGLRCEIQIQTILNHAWSETSHDILYKGEHREGFGTRGKEGIKKRFERIMDKYLLPAGYEIQKAQHDYERLNQGRVIFDQDIPRLLSDAMDNNARYELLTGIRDYALPNFDDAHSAHEALRGPLIEVVRASRLTEPLPIQTAFGGIAGQTSADVTKVAIEIIETLRYADVVGSIKTLSELYREEEDESVRQKIFDATKRLSEFNLDVWKQIGPGIQSALLEYLETLESSELSEIQPIATVICQEVTQPSLSGTSWTAESVVFETAALPVSHVLRDLRTRAIDTLFKIFLMTRDDDQQGQVLGALDAATRVPNQGDYSDDLLVLSLRDATRIVEFLTKNAGRMSFEILQHEEHRFLWDYRRSIDIQMKEHVASAIMDASSAHTRAIETFRDAINLDKQFVRFKVLVGFESVFPGHWQSEEFDYNEEEAYRKEQCELFLSEMTVDNEQYWMSLLERCASTKSTDLATFPTFIQFLISLAKRKPKFADKILRHMSPTLHGFLPAFLNGLAQSDSKVIYQRHLEGVLSDGTHLVSLAKHLRSVSYVEPSFPVKVLARSIGENDDVAVIECLVFYIEQVGTGKIENERAFFRSAMRYLNRQSNARWVRGAWYLRNAEPFYDALNGGDVDILLESLRYLPKIDYQAERVLRQIAKRHPEAVWDYFGERVAREKAEQEEEEFEAVPFSFHGLEKVLSTDPALAVEKCRSWYEVSNRLFRYTAGRLLKNSFPRCETEFTKTLVDLVENGDDIDTRFVLDVLENYEGEQALHIVLKRIIGIHARNPEIVERVAHCIDRTGVVSGEYGFVDALREKRLFMEAWLSDSDAMIREFAAQHIRELDIHISVEHKRADDRIALRRLEFSHEGDADVGDRTESS